MLYNKLDNYIPFYIKKDQIPGKTNDFILIARNKSAQKTSQSIDAYPPNHPKILQLLKDSYIGFYKMIEANRGRYIQQADLAPVI